MSKEWIFSDDFKIKFSDKLFNEFMSTDNFKWTDELVKEFVCDLLWWNKDEPKPKNFTSKETGSHKLLEDFKASKQQSVSKDKDFEVTAYRYKLNGNVWQKVNAQRFELPNTQFWLSARDMADGLNYEIYSVKRLSDNEVFSVGDNHSGSSYSNRVVKGFIIKNDEMFIIQYGGNTKLKDAKKVKQLLFTTEDGQGIFTKQPLWLVILKDLSKRYGIVSLKGQTEVMEYVYMPENVKYFYSEEAANEYILMNKPCLSVQDLKNTFNSHHFGEGEYQLEKLKKLAQSKIKK